MSGSREREFQSPLGPQTGKVTVIAVTAVSQHIDLTGKAIKADLDKRRLITLKAEADVWYRWSLATAGETVNEADTTTNDQCSWISAGERVDDLPPAGTQGIVVKAPGNCKLRLHVGSEPYTT
jgi:hypothetical protein